jgi:hypothetical protein
MIKLGEFAHAIAIRFYEGARNFQITIGPPFENLILQAQFRCDSFFSPYLQGSQRVNSHGECHK